MLKVTVVMAVYNSHRYIIQQLDSILSQSVPVDEVIIYDDASTDDTVSVISGYIETNALTSWHLYTHDRNQGFVNTFTDAMRQAHGDIVILSDHDDIWLDNKTAVIKETFEKHDEVLSLATGFVKIDEKDHPITERNRFGRANNGLIRRTVKKGALNQMTFRDCAVYNIAPGCTCAFRNGICMEFLETEDALPHDWKINLIAACRGGLFYLDVPTTKYRLYPGNTYGLGHQSMYEKRIRLCKSALEEKKAILKLVQRYPEGNRDNIRYACRVERLFEKRYVFIQSGKVLRSGLPLLLRSMGTGHLYESIAMDIVSVLKYRYKRGE